ncbi:MAG: phosphoheptose isomerase [Flavobacteriaceae bacterium]|nr:phosphoheptose isomerase [Flavobacteriaceae bacterium]|tara:strand:+ start:3489 stop:4046 length:558 start_codon:yes stop_codon:yes gene_type:complete
MLDLESYFNDYEELIRPDFLFDSLELLKRTFISVRDAGAKLVIVGNGASSSIASHAALDFTKQAGVTSVTLHDPALITAYTNDYGGDHWVLEACKHHVNSLDVVVFISVSGESLNLVNAAAWLKSKNIRTVSFTGSGPNTSLAALSNVNLFVPSHAYNIVECIHMIWITAVIDMIIGKKLYSVKN